MSTDGPAPSTLSSTMPLTQPTTMPSAKPSATHASPKSGKIFLVGLGPGDIDQMTARARAAIAAADVAIGYRTYLRLVAHLLEGKEVIERGMAEEIDRCSEAVALARRGRVVALVSSGDVGVFGMAGPLYEVLLAQGWTPDSGIAVEVVPGITAASACASLVGAPLTHDFCAISLSDMLTPWTVIAARLEAAARADFVTVFYNPKSSRRPDQIREAQTIFLRHRSPTTPVAIVHAAYRPHQSVDLTSLAGMLDRDIGMTSAVILGNRSSRVQSGIMLTPRGYAHKYDISDGQPRPGESPRVSLSSGLNGWRSALTALATEQGIQQAAAILGANPTQVLETLRERGDTSPMVVREPSAAALLDEALGWRGATLHLPSSAASGATLAVLDLAGVARGDQAGHLTLSGAGWTLELPWTRVAAAYRVLDRQRVCVWLQGPEGDTLLRIEGVL